MPPPRIPPVPRDDAPRVLLARSKLGLREPLNEPLRWPVLCGTRGESPAWPRVVAGSTDASRPPAARSPPPGRCVEAGRSPTEGRCVGRSA
jgi:hypothetical protein